LREDLKSCRFDRWEDVSHYANCEQGISPFA
jgi:hypothetical protein